MEKKKTSKQKEYSSETVTIVSPKNEELDLSVSIEVKNADDYDEDYLNMIFGN